MSTGKLIKNKNSASSAGGAVSEPPLLNSLKYQGFMIISCYEIYFENIVSKTGN
jgi:hypothetical protein